METETQEYPSNQPTPIPYFHSGPVSVVQQLPDANLKTIILQTEQPAQTVYVKTLTLPLLHLVQPSSFQSSQQLQTDRSSLSLDSNSSVIVTPVLHSEGIGQSQSLVQKQGGQTVTLNIVGALSMVPETGLSQTGLVTAHAKSKNIGKYVCKHCGRDCLKPSVLEKHIRSHTGERPFPCTTCNVAFKTQSNLYKHRRTQTHVNNARLSSESESCSVSDENEMSKSTNATDYEAVGANVKQLVAGSVKVKDTIESDISFHMSSTEKNLQDVPQESTSSLKVDTQELSSDDHNNEMHTEKTATANRKLESPNVSPVSVLPSIFSHKKVIQGQNTPTTNKHIQLQRQQATYFGKQWSHRSSDSSPRKCESTDSGYLSHSDSAEQQLWCSSPFHSLHEHSTESEPEKTPNILSSKKASSKAESEFNDKRAIFPVEKKKLEEHISKLISDNKAVVDDKQLENVRPRKTILSKQGSIDLPMPYTYKDSFHFDIRSLDASRKPSTSLSLTKSTCPTTEKSKPVFYSVPTQFSTMVDCIPITRSNSLSFNESIKMLQDNIRGSVHPFHNSQSPHISPSSLLHGTNLTANSVDFHTSHPRALVRQIAMDDLPAGNNGAGVSQSEARKCPCTSERGLSNTKCRNVSIKYGQRKQKMFSQEKWLMYGDETFKKIYQKMKNCETAKKGKHKIIKNKDSVVLSSKIYDRMKDKSDSCSTSTETNISVIRSHDCLPIVMTPSEFLTEESKEHNLNINKISPSHPCQNSNSVITERTVPLMFPTSPKEKPVVFTSSKNNVNSIPKEPNSEWKGDSYPVSSPQGNCKKLELKPQLSTSSIKPPKVHAFNLSQPSANLQHPRLVRQPSILVTEPVITQENNGENNQTAQSVLQLQNRGSVKALSASQTLLSETKKLRVDERKSPHLIISQSGSSLESSASLYSSSRSSASCASDTRPYKWSKHLIKEDMKKVYMSYDSSVELTRSIESVEQLNSAERLAKGGIKYNQLLDTFIPESNISASAMCSTVEELVFPKSESSLFTFSQHDLHKCYQNCTVQQSNQLSHPLSKPTASEVQFPSETPKTQVLPKEVTCSAVQFQGVYTTPSLQQNAFSPKYQLKLPHKKSQEKKLTFSVQEEKSKMPRSSLPVEATPADAVGSPVNPASIAPKVVFQSGDVSLPFDPKQQLTIEDVLKDSQSEQPAAIPCFSSKQTSNAVAAYVGDNSEYSYQQATWAKKTKKENESNEKPGTEFKVVEKHGEHSHCFTLNRSKNEVPSVVYKGEFSMSPIIGCQIVECTRSLTAISPLGEILSSFSEGHIDHTRHATSAFPSHHLNLDSCKIDPLFQGTSKSTLGTQCHLDAPLSQYLTQVKYVSENTFVTCRQSSLCQLDTIKSRADTPTKVPLPPNSHFKTLRSFYPHTTTVPHTENSTHNMQLHNMTLLTLNVPTATTKVSFSRTHGEPSLTWCCLKRSLPQPTEQKEKKNSAYSSLHTYTETLAETATLSQYKIAFPDLKKTIENTTCTITTTAGLKTMDSSITWTTDKEKVALAKAGTEKNSDQTKNVLGVCNEGRRKATKYSESDCVYNKHVKTNSRRYKPSKLQMKMKRLCKYWIQNKLSCVVKKYCQPQKILSAQHCKHCDFTTRCKGKMLKHVKVQGHSKKVKLNSQRKLTKEKELTENDGENACGVNMETAVPLTGNFEEFRQSKEFHSTETVGDYTINSSLQELCLFPAARHTQKSPVSVGINQNLYLHPHMSTVSSVTFDKKDAMEGLQSEIYPLMTGEVALETRGTPRLFGTCRTDVEGETLSALKPLVLKSTNVEHAAQKRSTHSFLQSRQSSVLATAEQGYPHLFIADDSRGMFDKGGDLLASESLLPCHELQVVGKNNRAYQKPVNTNVKLHERSKTFPTGHLREESTSTESVIHPQAAVVPARRKNLGMTRKQTHLEYSDISSDDDDEDRLVIEIEPHEPNMATTE